MRSNKRELIRSVVANFPVTRRSAYEGTTEGGGSCNLSKTVVSHHDHGLGGFSNDAILRLRDAVAMHYSGRLCTLAEHAVLKDSSPSHLVPTPHSRSRARACVFIAAAEVHRMGHSAGNGVSFLPWQTFSQI